MKNKNKIILITITILILIGIICFIKTNNTDAIKFKKEYSEVKISKNNPVIYLNDETILKALSGKDKLIFLGSNKSKTTKKAIKPLLKVADDKGIDKIYYYDITNIKSKNKINEKITKKINKTKIISPTLLLIKNNQVTSIEEGLNKDTKEKYDDIMLEYIMCTSNC